MSEKVAGIVIAGAALVGSALWAGAVVGPIIAEEIEKENLEAKAVEHIKDDLYSYGDMLTRNRDNDILTFNCVNVGHGVMDIYGLAADKDNLNDAKSYYLRYNLETDSTIAMQNIVGNISTNVIPAWEDFMLRAPSYVSIQDANAINFEMTNAKDLNTFNESLRNIAFKETNNDLFNNTDYLTTVTHPVFSDTKVTTDDNGDKYIVTQLTSLVGQVEKDKDVKDKDVKIDMSFDTSYVPDYLRLNGATKLNFDLTIPGVLSKRRALVQNIFAMPMDKNNTFEEAKQTLFEAIKDNRVIDFSKIEVTQSSSLNDSKYVKEAFEDKLNNNL